MIEQAHGIDQVITALQAGNRNMSELITKVMSLFQTGTGQFTMPAASSVTVANTNITATSVVFITPTNAAAATLMQSSKSLYLSARTTATSFQFSTADAGSAAGTETFVYAIFNPT